MMNAAILLALLELAERAPKSKTEIVWLMAIKEEIERQFAEQEAAQASPSAETTPPSA